MGPDQDARKGGSVTCAAYNLLYPTTKAQIVMPPARAGLPQVGVMILHRVFYEFRADMPDDAGQAILSDLQQFNLTLEGVAGFNQGQDRNFDAKSQGVTDGFNIRFRDGKALDHYAVHPTHKIFGARLCDLCTGGAVGNMISITTVDRSSDRKNTCRFRTLQRTKTTRLPSFSKIRSQTRKVRKRAL
ncbi:Dabb family protein [Marivita sp.]|uniref:Dabb family protein n=1 Tax=Marivita sp. TaxID=2003365 RepID=UPI003F6AA8AE